MAMTVRVGAFVPGVLDSLVTHTQQRERPPPRNLLGRGQEPSSRLYGRFSTLYLVGGIHGTYPPSSKAIL
jgi:hypothetical protein